VEKVLKDIAAMPPKSEEVSCFLYYWSYCYVKD